MRLYTIGTTRTTAERFFGALDEAGVKRLLDVRLRGTSQLDGFTKRRDLEFFARRLLDVPLEHVPEAAPTHELLDDLRARRIDWHTYEAAYGHLLEERRVEEVLTPERLDGACFVCSEHGPHRCHRRLLAEYLADHHVGVQVTHLVPSDGAIQRPRAARRK